MKIEQARLFMKDALDLARNSGDDLPVGALIVVQSENGFEIIAGAANEKEKLQDPTAHAEIQAMRKACEKKKNWRLDDVYLISTLEPCAMCAEAMIQARIRALYFGAYDEKSGACGSAFNLFQKGRIYPVPEVVGGVEEEDCRRLLLDFFQLKRGS